MAKSPMGLGMPQPIGGSPQPEPDGDEGMPGAGSDAQIKDLVSQLAEALGGHCEWGDEGAGEPDGDEMMPPPPAGPMR